MYVLPAAYMKTGKVTVNWLLLMSYLSKHLMFCWCLPSRQSQASLSYLCIFRLDALALSVIATATWLGGWVSVTAGIVSKRLNLSENFLDHLVGTSFEHLGPLTPIPNSTGNPFIGGVKHSGGGKIGDFRSIFDVHRRLSRKRCEIGWWLLWNVNRKSWVPDWMG